MTVWDEIQFPFDPALQDAEAVEVAHSAAARSHEIEENYSIDASGTVTITIANLTAGYQRSLSPGALGLQRRAWSRPPRRACGTSPASRPRAAGGDERVTRSNQQHKRLRSRASLLRRHAAFSDASAVCVRPHAETRRHGAWKAASVLRPSPLPSAATWARTSMRCATIPAAAGCTAAWRRRPCKTIPADSAQLGAETIAPILRRGVLLDIAGANEVDALPPDFAITPGASG